VIARAALAALLWLAAAVAFSITAATFVPGDVAAIVGIGWGSLTAFVALEWVTR